MKRIISLALVLLLIVALVGCGGKKRKPITLTLSSEDSAQILAAAGIKLPAIEEAKGANSTVKWFSWYDPFQNYDEGEMVNTGYYTFKEMYKSNVEFVESTYEDKTTKLAQLILSDDAPDLYPAGASNTAMFPLNCLNDMFQPVDPYFDFTDPLWEDIADAADYFLLGGYHYAIVTELKFKDVVPYNTRVMSDYGYEDPYELYQNDEWTWSKFYEMCLDFNDPDNGRFAVDGWYVVNGIVEQSTGHYIVERDEDGHYYANLDDPIIEAGENLIYDLCKNDCFYREGTDYWALHNYPQGHGVKDGTCLFWPAAIDEWGNTCDDYASTYGDTRDNELMFVPYPRYDEGDGIYYLSTIPSGFAIVKGAPNPEGAALLATCTRFKIIDPTVVSIDEKQYRQVLHWSDDMMDMYKHCKELATANLRMFYTGNLPEQAQDAYNWIDWGMCRTGGSNSWAQLKEQYGERLTYYLDDTNVMIDNYVPGQGSVTTE